MARTVDDCARPQGEGSLPRRKAVDIPAPKVAGIMARELGRDKDWVRQKVGSTQIGKRVCDVMISDKDPYCNN
jgi:hypothetical protein